MKMVLFVLCILAGVVVFVKALFALLSPFVFALGYTIGICDRVLTMADLTAMLGGLVLLCIALLLLQLVMWMYTDWT